MELARSSVPDNNINTISLSRKLRSFASVPQTSLKHPNRQGRRLDADLRVNKQNVEGLMAMKKNVAPIHSNIRHSFEQPSSHSNDVVNELNSKIPIDRSTHSQNMKHKNKFPIPDNSRRPSTRYSNLSVQKTRSSFRSDRRLKQDRNVNDASSKPGPKTRNFGDTLEDKKPPSRNQVAFSSQNDKELGAGPMGSHNIALDQGRHIGQDFNLNLPEKKPSINYRTLLDQSRHTDIQGQNFGKGRLSRFGFLKFYFTYILL